MQVHKWNIHPRAVCMFTSEIYTLGQYARSQVKYVYTQGRYARSQVKYTPQDGMQVHKWNIHPRAVCTFTGEIYTLGRYTRSQVKYIP